jgi:N-acetylglucosaminyl-diphospho-decaprenol L-rhamnosyltransferase
MHVAICIVGFRNPTDIATCLEALSRSTHADFEVVICENGGPEAAGVLAERLPRALAGGQAVRIVTAQTNLGYAGGVNVCLRAAPGADAWWVLNPDTRPDPTALEHLVARLSRGDCAAAGSTIYFADGKVQGRGGQFRPWLARAVGLDYGKALNDPPSADLEARLWYLSGASMIVGRQFIDRVGEMREDYFLYGEEVEWCLRAREAGLTLGLAPASNVLHQQGTTTGSVQDMRQRSRTAVYLDERNKMLLTRDHFALRLPVVAPAALAMLALRFGRRRAWTQLGYALSGWAAGLANRRGKPPWLDNAHG